MKTLEELLDNDELCSYCPLDESKQGVYCNGGNPVMCEGSHCGDAYEIYLEELAEIYNLK